MITVCGKYENQRTKIIDERSNIIVRADMNILFTTSLPTGIWALIGSAESGSKLQRQRVRPEEIKARNVYIVQQKFYQATLKKAIK